MAEVIPIGADHAGFALKERFKQELEKLGYQPLDLGTHSAESTDYPDYAHPVAGKVERGEARRGILLCGTGLGMAYAANRHHGVRAAVAWTPEIAELARSHNDANVLVLPARFVTEAEGLDILRTWLNTPFEGGRHERRVEKIEPKGD
jgi:ribose 5-phosphate isomerase B